jgi:hypothetical protein
MRFCAMSARQAKNEVKGRCRIRTGVFGTLGYKSGEGAEAMGWNGAAAVSAEAVGWIQSLSVIHSF